MSHPYKSQGKSTATSKFKSMGLPAKGARHADEGGAEKYGYARGGRTKATSVNVVIQPPQQQQQPQMPPPMPRPPTPMPPPPGGPMGGMMPPPPPAAPAGGGLLSPAGGGAPSAQPGMPSMMPRKDGGRIIKVKAHTRKAGGRIPTEGGAETGVGRLEKAGK